MYVELVNYFDVEAKARPKKVYSRPGGLGIQTLTCHFVKVNKMVYVLKDPSSKMGTVYLTRRKSNSWIVSFI